MSNLTIYSQIPAARYNASMYYRSILPLWTMTRLGIANVQIDNFDASVSNDQRYRDAMASDVYHTYQCITPALLGMVEESRGFGYQTAPNGKRLAPPSYIMDTDDDLFNVTPLNGAFNTLGIKDFNGNILKPGDKIWAIHPGTGEKILMWSDGENFNLSENLKSLDTYRENLRAMELITCSTPGVKDYLLRELGSEADSKIHIFPNCIDFSEYPEINLQETPGQVKILWQGSPTHYEDMMIIKNSFAKIMKKNPHVKFILWGANYPWFWSDIPAEQVELLPWMDYRIYKLRLSTIGHDIAIAPLRNTTFNASRSAIKWYESSATWKPAATIASNYGAFAREIEDGKTGMLFNDSEEFETKLQALIDDATLRKNIAANAKDWVRTNRDPDVHVQELCKKFSEVRQARMNWPENKGEVENGDISQNDSDLRGSQATDS